MNPTRKMYDGAVLVMALVISFVIAVIILFPLAVIWALNTLFGLDIPYNLWTWLAMVVLLLVLTRVSTSKKNE